MRSKQCAHGCVRAVIQGVIGAAVEQSGKRYSYAVGI